jgi:hypothetical protein
MPARETVTLAAPEIAAGAACVDKWRCEFEAFRRLLPDLLRTHRSQYVVIHQGQVVDSGLDDLALALRFFAQHGKVPVHIGLVTAEPELPVRIPHYRTMKVNGAL